MKQKQKLFEIMRFGLGGIVGVLLGYVTLYILKELIGIHYLKASTIAYVVSWLTNFVIQKFFTFRNKNSRQIPTQITLYFGIAIFYLVVDMGVMFLLVGYFHLHYFLAKVISTILLSIASYFTTKMIFKN